MSSPTTLFTQPFTREIILQRFHTPYICRWKPTNFLLFKVEMQSEEQCRVVLTTIHYYNIQDRVERARRQYQYFLYVLFVFSKFVCEDDKSKLSTHTLIEKRHFKHHFKHTYTILDELFQTFTQLNLSVSTHWIGKERYVHVIDVLYDVLNLFQNEFLQRDLGKPYAIPSYWINQSYFSKVMIQQFLYKVLVNFFNGNSKLIQHKDFVSLFISIMNKNKIK